MVKFIKSVRIIVITNLIAANIVKKYQTLS